MMETAANRFSKHQIADLVVLLLLAGIVIWYLRDAWQASSHIFNLVLILPVSAIILLLCLIQFIRQCLGRQPQAEEATPVTTVLPVMGLFAAYVLSLNWLGFDVGTFLLIATFLWVHGERRLPWMLGYALAFAVILAWAFSNILPYPMPMLLFPMDY
ncbi:MAG: tripartite tricarboxylate transporter TctB family protein [Pseudomonadota bacterium]